MECDSGEVQDVFHWLLSAPHGITSDNLFWKPWMMYGKTSQQETMETEQPLYYHMHVGTIIFDLLLTLCGQLGSSNPSVTNNLPLTLSVLTLVSLRMTHLYLFL